MLRPLLAALSLAVLGGCALHMDRMVPASASVFDERLLGTWASGKGERAVVTRRGPAEYDIAYTEKGEHVALRATRGELAGHTILELRLAAADDIDGWPAAKMLIVVHVDGDSATTQIIDKVALRAALARKGHVAFFEQDESVILTGTARTMRAVLGGDPGLAAMLEPTRLVWRRS